MLFHVLLDFIYGKYLFSGDFICVPMLKRSHLLWTLERSQLPSFCNILCCWQMTQNSRHAQQTPTQCLAVVLLYLCYSNESCRVGDDISMSEHCTFWVSWKIHDDHYRIGHVSRTIMIRMIKYCKSWNRFCCYLWFQMWSRLVQGRRVLGAVIRSQSYSKACNTWIATVFAHWAEHYYSKIILSWTKSRWLLLNAAK